MSTGLLDRMFDTEKVDTSAGLIALSDRLEEQHAETWRDKPDEYWLARLMQEVGELASALVGDHDDTPEWELAQIAAICRNWLRKRAGTVPASQANRSEAL